MNPHVTNLFTSTQLHSTCVTAMQVEELDASAIPFIDFPFQNSQADITGGSNRISDPAGYHDARILTINVANANAPAETKAAYKREVINYLQWICDEYKVNPTSPTHFPTELPALNHEWEDLVRALGDTEKKYELLRIMLVTPQRLLTYLVEVISKRKRKKTGRKRKASDMREEREEMETLCGFNTANTAIAALIKLWTDQKVYMKVEEANAAQHPRSPEVKQWTCAKRKEKHQHDRNNYKDPGVGAWHDGITETEDLLKISHYFFHTNPYQLVPSTRLTQTTIANNLRDRAMFLTTIGAILRGEDARAFELCNISHMVKPAEGSGQPMEITVFNVKQGKTNAFSHLQYASISRHKNPLLCPVGGIAMYLFYIYHVMNIAPPKMDGNRREWFRLKLFHNFKQLEKEVTESVHSKGMKAGIEHLGYTFSKVTHLGRGSGANIAMMGKATESQIKMHGRWNQSVVNAVYLMKVSFECLLALTGFDATAPGTYFLERAVLDPPTTLTDMIFPWATEYQNLYVRIREDREENTGVDPTMAGGAYLKWIISLRKIIIQDAAVMIERYPNHSLYQHPMFQSEEFISYKNNLQELMRDVVAPSMNQVIQAVPSIGRELQMMQQQSTRNMNEIGTRFGGLQERLQERFEIIASTLEAIEQRLSSIEIIQRSQPQVSL
jgi:hypothetical protein